MPPLLMFAWFSSIRTGKRQKLATVTPKKSPSCILLGVPPRIYPTFRSWSISPATADDTQTTAATPSTAATPLLPETPIVHHRKGGNPRVCHVKPGIGLLDEPIRPTRL